MKLVTIKKKRNLNEYEVFIDGIIIERIEVNKSEAGFEIECNGRTTGEDLLQGQWNKLSTVEYIKIWDWMDLEYYDNELSIGRDVYGYGPLDVVLFYFIQPLKDWSKSYSSIQYREVFIRKWKYNFASVDSATVHFSSDEFLEFYVNFKPDFSDIKLLEKISVYENLIKTCHLMTERELLPPDTTHSVSALFNFPEKIREPCEQYLVYFARFLTDLGVDANSSLKHHSGNILFTVTPTNELQSLDKIREALTIYLSLPSSPVVYDESFSSMRLQQQIANLQHSQTMAGREIQLAQKVIQIQDRVIDEKKDTILQQNSTIQQQRRIIEKITSSSIMIDSLENKEEFVQVCEGLSIGESEFLKKHFGIRFNPARLFGNIGNRLTGGEDNRKSILGLEEEDKDIEQ